MTRSSVYKTQNSAIIIWIVMILPTLAMNARHGPLRRMTMAHCHLQMTKINFWLFRMLRSSWWMIIKANMPSLIYSSSLQMEIGQYMVKWIKDFWLLSSRVKNVRSKIRAIMTVYLIIMEILLYILAKEPIGNSLSKNKAGYEHFDLSFSINILYC